jgi:mannosyltransferase OCH1-like enzyme
LLASSNTPSIITNGLIAAKPGNKLFLEMMEEMKKPAGLSSIERHLLVMNTTGPWAFNAVIKRLELPYKLLPSSQLNPYTICDKEYNKPNTLMRPLEGSSWVGGGAFFWHWCYCQSNYIILYSFIIGLLLLLFILFYFNLIG